VKERAAVAVASLLAFAGPADAKDFASLVVVGADGHSVELRPQPTVIDGLFAGRVSAPPRGGYLRVYPLGPSGFVGAPGRFYPRTAAVCLSWRQAAPPRGCRRARRPLLDALAQAESLAEFRGVGTAVRELAGVLTRPPLVPNLRVAVELAFDRSRLARRASPPRRCLRFLASWRGPLARARPRDICLSARGVYAGGRLYPLGAEPWRLAWLNRCPLCGTLRRIAQAGVSALHPRGWYVQTVDRHVVNPRLRFQLSTAPGEDGASVSADGLVIRVEELLQPLLTREALVGFPPRPARFDLSAFERMASWPLGRGTRFRERGRAIYVWVAFGRRADPATRARALAVLDSLRVSRTR